MKKTDTQRDRKIGDLATSRFGMSMNIDFERWLRNFPIVLLCGIMLYSVGYYSISSDHFQYLLPSLRGADPGFGVGDWFIENTQHYHYFFQGVGYLAGEVGQIQTAFLVLHLLGLAVLLFALRSLSKLCGAPFWGMALVTFVLVFGTQRTWGDVDLLGQTALPHYLGTSVSLLALALTLERRTLFGAVIGAICAYVHFAIGFWTLLLISMLYLSELVSGRLTKRELRRPVLVAGLLLSPLILKVSTTFLDSSTSPDAYKILFFARSPHHYDFASFGSDRHFSATLVIAVALICAFFLGKRARGLLVVTLSLLVICLVSAFFLHVVYWPTPARLFPWRMSPLFIVVAAIASTSLVVRKDIGLGRRFVGVASMAALIWDGQRRLAVVIQGEEGDFWDVLVRWFAAAEWLTLLVFFVVGSILVVSEAGQGFRAALLRNAVTILLLLEFIVVVLPNHRELEGSGIFQDLRVLAVITAAIIGLMLADLLACVRSKDKIASKDWLGSVSLLSVACIGLAFVAQFPPIRTTEWLRSDQKAVGELLKEVVPAGDVVLIPPDAMSVRFASGRAVVVDFKAFPMVGKEMQEWFRRMERVSGADLDGIKGSDILDVAGSSYNSRTLESLRETAREFGASYILVRSSAVAAEEALAIDAEELWGTDTHLLVAIGYDESK